MYIEPYPPHYPYQPAYPHYPFNGHPQMPWGMGNIQTAPSVADSIDFDELVRNIDPTAAQVQPQADQLGALDAAAQEKSALDTQVGGGHYKDQAIQPIEYIHANKLGFCEGNVVKYITRWKSKNGLQDLLKVKHYVDLLIELEGLNQPKS